MRYLQTLTDGIQRAARMFRGDSPTPIVVKPEINKTTPVRAPVPIDTLIPLVEPEGLQPLFRTLTLSDPALARVEISELFNTHQATYEVLESKSGPHHHYELDLGGQKLRVDLWPFPGKDLRVGTPLVPPGQISVLEASQIQISADNAAVAFEAVRGEEGLSWVREVAVLRTQDGLWNLQTGEFTKRDAPHDYMET